MIYLALYHTISTLDEPFKNIECEKCFYNSNITTFQTFQNIAKWVYFGPLFFSIHFTRFSYMINWIWHSLTVEIKFYRTRPENFYQALKFSKGFFNNIFQDSFNKILSQQLTHDRCDMYPAFSLSFSTMSSTLWKTIHSFAPRLIYLYRTNVFQL